MKHKISMLLPIYNEEKFLSYSLENTIPSVDEVIIIDGSPWGVSTDNSLNIIDDFHHKYPNKIKYFSGTFALPVENSDEIGDGAWDESAQRNLGLSKVSGDILMPHCGDMIYAETDMLKMIEAMERFPDAKIIYCPFVEFWIDQKHIRLYTDSCLESCLPVCANSDVNFLSMDIVVGYFDGSKGMQIMPYTWQDFLYVPYAFRYHYGWVSGFDREVEKHIRAMILGCWEETFKEVKEGGERHIAAWAIKHTLSYPDIPCAFPYCGEVPIAKEFSYDDRKDETLAMYEEKYGKQFWEEYNL